jgi:tetratricopeptide (TPR) repeat protein
MSEFEERLGAALSSRYELEREIGRGGMAVVYLARDVKQGRQVALKVFQPDIAAAMGPARFRREIELATRLEHPHILSLYDSGEADGLLYYVMPFVSDGSLRDRLEREGQLPIEAALRIAREMAEGLDFAHEQGVVHRDVKPGNVLLQRGHAQLADFGVARALESSGAEKLTGTGVSVGTPQYMAPEQATGAGAVDGRSDVYAVGAVLYEMLTGEPPYTGPTPQAVLAKRMAGPPTPVPVLRETVPSEVDGIVQQAMARSAADRWQSAGDLAKALAAAERGGGTPIPGLATWPGVTGEVVAPGATPRNWKRWAGMAVAVAAVASLAVFGPTVVRSLRSVQTDPYRIAVVPSRPDFGPDRLASIVLGDGLDGWAYLRQVDPARLDTRLAGERGEVIGPDEGLTIAEDVGAGRIILVRSEDEGEERSVRATLYGVGDSLVSIATVDTTAESAGFSEDWYVDVLLRLFRGQDLGPGAELESANWIAEPRAMYPYFSALAHNDRGEWDSTTAYLREAVALDSTFAVAWRLLAGVAWHRAMFAPEEQRREYALLRDSARVFANRFREAPDRASIALAHAKRMAQLFPDSAELQLEVGGLYMMAALEQGMDPDSALPYYRRARQLDTMMKLEPFIIFELERGRLDSARAMIDLNQARGYEETLPILDVALAIVEARSQASRDSILFTHSDWGNFLTLRTAMMQDSMSIPRYVGKTTLDGDFRLYMLSLVELSAGRGSALDSLLQHMESERVSSDFYRKRAYANVPGGIAEPPEVVSRLRDTIQSRLDTSPNWSGQLVYMWYLGQLSVRLGEMDRALEYATQMDRLVSDSLHTEADSFQIRFGRDIPREVRASVAWREGDLESALALLEGNYGSEDVPPDDMRFGQRADAMFTMRGFARLLRGHILLELGRYEEAAGWYATFPWFLMYEWAELAYVAPAHRGRAMSLDALGRHEEALHYYRRFVTRWQDADPHLQPQVEEARQRIRELERELN